MPIQHVLVVEDSKSARLMLRKMLQGFDIHIAVAESADAALRYLHNQQPDAILTDHTMPSSAPIPGTGRAVCSTITTINSIITTINSMKQRRKLSILLATLPMKLYKQQQQRLLNRLPKPMSTLWQHEQQRLREQVNDYG
ncbi:MAG: hypothetical protein CSA09_02810 [Candidatus Contendobacter odensis]|uniref:Response regulatory domain-containing protein n=1 Tax=Candidatus Contendibacter odensensis TaxID=1400860 RepID=A0A2G6PGC5_9GAMM|nr:MAG: hypothetical protein CSA09_02810 [Candidatus Contendobacter odensis]